MNLIAPTKAFRDALAKLGPVVPKGRAVRNAGLACVRLSAGDLLDDPTVFASDGLISARLSIEGCETVDPGEVVVDYAKLMAAVAACPGDAVMLATGETRQARLIVRSENATANLSLDADIQDRLTAPESPQASPIDSGTLFPIISRLMAVAAREDKGSAISGVLWDCEGGEFRCVAIVGVAGLMETAPSLGGPIAPQRLLHKDWSVVESLIHGPASFGLSPFLSYWSAPGAEVWLRPSEHQLREDVLLPGKYVPWFKDGADKAVELDPGSVVDLQAALSAVVGLGSDSSTLRIESDGESWVLRTLSEVDPFEWQSVHPLPELDWRTGSPGAFLGCLKALSQKDGPATIAVIRDGQALRLERDGLTCVVAGYK